MTEQLTAYEKKVMIHKLRTEFASVFLPSEVKQKKILRIANRRFVGDLHFTRYIDYRNWIRNALQVTGG